MSTRSTLLYPPEVEHHVHVWRDVLTCLVTIECHAEDIELELHNGPDGERDRVNVRLTLPPQLSAAIAAALGKR